jgi:hypothetical protein
MSFSVKQRTDFGAAVKASVNIGFVRSQIMAAPKLGLWLARFALRLTGNREHANASRLLPLIPRGERYRRPIIAARIKP